MQSPVTLLFPEVKFPIEIIVLVALAIVVVTVAIIAYRRKRIRNCLRYSFIRLS
jgi:hypothetical protein